MSVDGRIKGAPCLKIVNSSLPVSSVDSRRRCMVASRFSVVAFTAGSSGALFPAAKTPANRMMRGAVNRGDHEQMAQLEECS